MNDEQAEKPAQEEEGWTRKKVTMHVRRAGYWLQAKISGKKYIMREVDEFKLPTDPTDIPF